MSENKSITYDASGVLIDEAGLAQDDLNALSARLEDVREEVLGDMDLLRSGKPIPEEKRPLEPLFIDLPERLLDQYRKNQETSEVGRIQAAANRLADLADNVVVIGIGGSYMGARSLFEACCHSYHNQLGRPARKKRPRLYFGGTSVDNDSTQALLDLFKSLKGGSPRDRIALIPISKSGGTLEPAVAFRQLLPSLQNAISREAHLLPELILPVTGPDSKLYNLTKSFGCRESFTIPDGIGGRFSILTAVGLLPAAVLGLDIIALLEGAVAMNKRFRSEAPGRNPVLDFAAVSQLMEARRGASVRILSFWVDSLEAVGFWYDQLLSESLGKNDRGATPITVINTRDLHSRGQQHQQGRRDKLITNVIVEGYRKPPLPVGEFPFDNDDLNRMAGKSLPQIMGAAIKGTRQAYAEDRRPTTDIYLPRVDEYSLGQLYQMMMLATVVEGRLIGTNPYGQPGVEFYKKHMNAILRTP